MTLISSAHDTLVTVASGGGEHGGEHSSEHASLSPYVIGGGTLLALFLLLWITTRFNRDR